MAWSGIYSSADINSSCLQLCQKKKPAMGAYYSNTTFPVYFRLERTYCCRAILYSYSCAIHAVLFLYEQEEIPGTCNYSRCAGRYNCINTSQCVSFPATVPVLMASSAKEIPDGPHSFCCGISLTDLYQ